MDPLQNFNGRVDIIGPKMEQHSQCMTRSLHISVSGM